MPRTDPHQRALHLAGAAALFNNLVVAAHLGLHIGTLLLPDPSDPCLLATAPPTGARRVTPGGAGRPGSGTSGPCTTGPAPTTLETDIQIGRQNHGPHCCRRS
ncbi:hypothetical protein OG426_01265 [Streptomyces canus]|uniref:hypothetical protein n=1 Tax=Streptomyces canus TaxID=58343 RepID=UPI0038640B1C|nr:hypothetical protein OG426_01265 [Streptomyces canus]